MTPRLWQNFEVTSLRQQRFVSFCELTFSFCDKSDAADVWRADKTCEGVVGNDKGRDAVDLNNFLVYE